MTPPQIELLSILGLAAAAIFFNLARPDLVAILVMLSMAVLGLITPEQALAGFSKPAVVALVGLFVVTRSLDANGVIHWLGERLERLGGTSEARLVAVFMTSGAVLSMVMNNIAAGSVLLPAAVGASRRSKISPSRILLPLSYGILLGGMATLFTTANLVVGGVLESKGLKSLSMLDFMGSGGWLLLVGVLYMVFFGRRFLPENVPANRLELPALASAQLSETYQLAESLYEGTVGEGFLVGQGLAQSNLEAGYGVSLLALFRGQTALFAPSPQEVFQLGDVLLLLGDGERMGRLEVAGLCRGRKSQMPVEQIPVQLVEAIVSPRSQAIGKDLVRLRLRDRYGLTAVGLWRHGKSCLTDIARFRLEAGDAVLMVGTHQRVASMAQSGDFLVPEQPPSVPGSTFKAVLTLTVASFAMAMAAKGLLPMALAMMLGGALLVAVGCLTMDDAYQGVEWNVVVLIAAMLPVGTALTSTGLAALIAQALEGMARFGPRTFEMASYLVAVLITQMVGGQVAALVVAPVAVASALELQGAGIDPRTVGLLIALGCSTAFMTPIAHPVNVLMMGPGGYRPADFLKAGLPLTLLCTAVVGLLLFFALI